MAAAGKQVDDVIAAVGLGHGEVIERVVAAVAAEGDYRTVQVTADRLQFARTFRPTWAIVAGIATIWVALLGVLFFFVSTTETCVASVESDHTGTRVRLSGKLTPALAGRIRAALQSDAPVAGASRSTGQPVASAFDVAPSLPAPRVPTAPPAPRLPSTLPPPLPPTPASAPLPPTLASAPPPSARPLPTTPPQQVVAPVAGHAAPSRVTMPPPSPASSPPATHAEQTIAVVRQSGTPATAGPVLVLDDGRSIPVDGFVLLGRDPSGEGAVAVEDATRSVSKTHLRIEIAGARWSVTDLHSTNGSSITDAAGIDTPLRPGTPVEASPGDVVRFGDRSLSLSPIRPSSELA